MQVNEVVAKSILRKTKLPKDICPGKNYIINPFIGCFFGCAYCFATFMRKFSQHTEDWGEFVDVKVNAVEVLRRELERNPINGVVEMGSVTDAYQPVEEKYRLTRSILSLLLDYEFHISIATKSCLVLRDISIFKKFSQCNVGISLSSLNSKVCETIEPSAPSPSKRIETLKELSRNGIRTFALVSPVIPVVTELRKIFYEITPYVDLIIIDKLNTRGISLQKFKTMLSLKDCELFEETIPLINDSGYWSKMHNEIKLLSEELDVAVLGVGCFSGIKHGEARWF